MLTKFHISIFTKFYCRDGSIRYVSIKTSIIEFDLGNKYWKLTDVANPNISAITTSSFQSLALGNHEWEIQNDRRCQEGVFSSMLSLTACKKDEYTCNDGLCLPIDQRCNGKPECKDKSDEANVPLL